VKGDLGFLHKERGVFVEWGRERMKIKTWQGGVKNYLGKFDARVWRQNVLGEKTEVGTTPGAAHRGKKRHLQD